MLSEGQMKAQKTIKMYANPDKVKELLDKKNKLEAELALTKNELFSERSLVPCGYKLLEFGDIVGDDSVCYEPYHEIWDKTNSKGKVINKDGYTIDTHRGWKFANRE